MKRLIAVSGLLASGLYAQLGQDAIAYANCVIGTNCTQSGNNPTLTFTVPIGTGANRTLGVAVALDGSPQNLGTVTALTVGGTALIKKTQCTDSQYQRHDAEIWVWPTGSQPPSGTQNVVITANGWRTIFAAVVYSLTNADPVFVDQSGCDVHSYGTNVTSDSVTLNNGIGHDYTITVLIAPNTNNPINVTGFPGTEDILYSGSNGDVGTFSHVADAGTAGNEVATWSWTQSEPDAMAVVSFKPQAGSSGSCGTGWGANCASGPDSAKPATCPSGGVSFYMSTDIPQLFYCYPGGSVWLQAKVKNTGTWDTWAMAFHDAKHTGRSRDILLPPLTVAWNWKDNHAYDLQFIGEPAQINLPIGFNNGVSDAACWMGGFNANRLFCYNSRSGAFLWETDNTHNVEAGGLDMFFNYPAYVNGSPGSLILGMADYTIAVSAADGASNYHELYNTFGFDPNGGFTVNVGLAYQQFRETDATDTSENYNIYTNPATLTYGLQFHSHPYDANSYSIRIPAVDSDGSSYVNIISELFPYSSTGVLGNLYFTGLEQSFTLLGASPAVASGVAYIYNIQDSSLHAVVNGVSQWANPIAGAMSPLLDNGTLYVGSNDGKFYAVRASDGNTLWSFNAGASFTSLQIPAISGNLIYVPCANGNLYALNLSNGTNVYTFHGPMGTALGPVAITGGMIVVSDTSNTVYGLRPAQAIQGPIAQAGTIVNGVCCVHGTGFHVQDGILVSNEVQGNCIIGWIES
jgi:outer membrane protein assembly factor BamB